MYCKNSKIYFIVLMLLPYFHLNLACNIITYELNSRSGKYFTEFLLNK